MKTVDFIGTVSHGTMRDQDLIPVFYEVLETYYPESLDVLAYTKIKDEIEDDSHPYWNSEDAMWDLNEDMWDALEEIAPEGYYFGAHPGDGADYGFWAFESEEELWESN